jgi:hypothetical protein
MTKTNIGFKKGLPKFRLNSNNLSDFNEEELYELAEEFDNSLYSKKIVVQKVVKEPKNNRR